MGAYKLFVALKGILLCGLAIFFIAYPGNAANIFAQYLGILMLLGGLVSFFYTRYINKKMEAKTLSYLPSIIAVSGGTILLVFSQIALAVFAISIGLWIFIDGLNQLKISKDVKSYHRSMGNWMIIMGVVSLILGLLIVYRPHEFIKFMTIFFGIIMFVAGVFHVFLALRLKEETANFDS